MTKFSMDASSAFEIINSGSVVVDIGQISLKTTRWLRERAVRGHYVEFTFYGYPKPKQSWCLPNRQEACAGYCAA